MTTTATKIKCPKCHGTGRAALTPVLVEALAVVRRHGEITADEYFNTALHDRGVRRTAANARLEKLRALGLVTRKRARALRKSWVYSIAK